MLTSRRVDLFGIVAIAIWFAASVYFAASQNGDFFQRMGAFGIGVAVVYFGLVERFRRPLMSHGLHERLMWISATLDQLARSNQVAFSNITLLAKHLEVGLAASGRKIPSYIAILASPIDHAFETAQKDREFSANDMLNKLREVKQASEEADKHAELVKGQSHIVELSLAAIATIQWGFGDLLFLNGCAQC